MDGGRGIVGQFVPHGFEACAWLPNPAWKWTHPDTGGATLGFGVGKEELWAKPVKWFDVATSQGERMDRHRRWTEIAGRCTGDGRRAVSPDQVWTWGPCEGTIEPFIANTLCKVLTRWTHRDDRCLSGQWEGVCGGWDTKVKLVAPEWTYFVWECRFGELADWLRQAHSFEREAQIPHVVWPEDRAWFLTTLYSGVSNYVAGSREIVNAVLESDVEGV